ncbi:thiamine ABC transporter substrate binding subunit [Sulfurovum sp. XGS-02]|uniref:thiamine ABC transporter substrate binding subunit n=1 Tax=Sulfurovum sp. XGS-02 TaxID=2925411 RepID=UPI002053F01B|nr:thiamine ABC transporter substrate binding subunit [Sulfurovum sp. XGS-02]UPT78005.1 thiamine ABC transporter substrate binding subunit [Sulfurovum sp. XGS-02]
MIKILYALLLITVIALSNEKPTLTIYTYDAFAVSWGPGPKIKEAFEKEYDCNVKFVGMSSSIGALRKIQLEGKNTKADIILGLDTNIAQAANKTGLFAKHDMNTSNLDLPVPYTDENFVPFDYSYVAFVYDSDKLKDPPTSFEALASMPEDFKIIIQDPRSSTPGLSLLLWVKEIYKEKAGEYWKKLSPHILTITKGWSESYGLFLKGEADMVLSYTTSPAYHMIEENRTNFKSARFDEGHYGQIEVAAMLKSSKHKDLAKQFLRFMYSETFAEIIPTANWAYPVVKTKQGLPKVFETLTQPSKMILLDGKTVELHRKAIINEWLQSLER